MTVVDAFWATVLGVGLLGCLVLRGFRRALRRGVRQWQRHPIRSTLAVVAVVARLRRKPAPLPSRLPALEGDDIYRSCPLSLWEGGPWACRWCNRLLPARSTRWCSPQCRVTARANHEFGPARDAALQRDGYRCIRLGCGAMATFERALEVNHKTLIHGRHNEPGCHHHLDGLESLCGRHHDEVTAGQRARRWAS